MQTAIIAFALLLYSAFFLYLNFTLYQWVNKTVMLTKTRIVLLTILFVLAILFLIPGIFNENVMQPGKFFSTLMISGFILGSHFFGRFAIARFKRTIPREKHDSKVFNYMIGFHYFFWYKLNFIFFSLAQLFMIWSVN